MQRAEVLLQKLNEQILSSASASHILVTLQLLQREYLQKAETETPINSTVSVVLPYTITDKAINSERETTELNAAGVDDPIHSFDTNTNFNELVVDISIDAEQVMEPHSFSIQTFQEDKEIEKEVLLEINDQLKESSNAVVDFFN